MKTLTKIATLILLILIISCNKEKGIESQDIPEKNVGILTNKDSYINSEQIIVKIANNTNNEIQFLACMYMKPYYLKFKKENEEWINKGAGHPCPDFNKNSINPNSIKTDTFSLINYETGIYRLKLNLYIENIDTNYYSNEFEIK
jgi:hypothetical protein